jgi:uncharacterized protein YhjY with autotransporter beta-barrel domain
VVINPNTEVTINPPPGSQFVDTNVVFGNGTYVPNTYATLRTADAFWRGSWSVNASDVEIIALGASIYAPSVPGTVLKPGLGRLRIFASDLQLSPNSFTPGLFGPNSLFILNRSAQNRPADQVRVEDADWLNQLAAVNGSLFLATSLVIDTPDPVNYTGGLSFRTGSLGRVQISNFGTGTVRFAPSVIRGDGDLAVVGTMTLAPSSGTYSGALMLGDGGFAGANVTISTLNAIGANGVRVVNDSTLTLENSITTGTSQTMDLGANLTIQGDGSAARALNWSGRLTGSGNLSINNELEFISNGDASTFSGDLAASFGSQFFMRDLSGFAARGTAASLSLDESSFYYTGTSAVSLSSQLIFSGSDVTLGTNFGSTLALTGALAPGFTGNVILGGDGQITFSPTGSTYGGRLQLDGVQATIGTANAIGSSGLEVLGQSTLTLANSITTGTSQTMDLGANLLLRGATGTQQLNWNGDIDTGVSDLTLERLQLNTAATSNLTGTESIVLDQGGILSLNGATAQQRILGNGGLLGGPGTVGQLGDAGGFNGTIQLGNGSSRGTLQTTGSAFVANAFIESLLFAGTGTADRLEAGSLLDGLDRASMDLIYDATVSGGPLVPATGAGPVSYTVLSGTVVADATPGQLTLTIIDPLNGQSTVQTLSTTGPNVDSSGAQFEWIATDGAAGSGVFRITGAPSPTIAGGGSTSTNIGTVSNVTIRNAVNSVNSIMQLPGQTPDGQYVGTSLLLLSPGVLPGAVVTAAVPGNPDALPNTMFDSMSQAGQVARLRLMQLRTGGGTAAPAAGGGGIGMGSSASDDRGSYECSLTQVTPSTEAVSEPLAIGAGINGGSPQSGARVWARGYGFSSSVNGQSYAQGDYSAAMGGVMVGADASLDGGLLAGAFVGYTPGSLTIDSTLGNTQTSLNGVSFGGYTSWSPEDGHCYAQGYAMAGYNYADQTRNVQIPGLVRTATSSADVWGAMVGGEGGLNLDLGDAATLQPYVGLEYGYYTRGGYAETGAGSLNLTVSGQDANLLQPTAGARVMKTFGLGADRLTPYLGAAFIAQVPLGSWSESATNGFSGAQVFTFSEGADDQYGASFEAGLEFASIGGWTAYVSFNGLAMTDTTVFGGQLGINLSF